MLSRERARAVVEKVEAELLTPFGLRSLSQHDPEYCGRCAGSIQSRDGAYHQGTIWGWLIGPFITAYLRVNDRTPEAIARAWQMISYFTGHLRDAGLGQVSEIFDGDPPYRAAGCIAQAWSVAELLRVAVDLDQ
jgi:glycogen debranching enzyme